MSLIEKAIEKMRANEAGVAAGGRPVPRAVSASPRVDVTQEQPPRAGYAAPATPAKKLLIDRVALRAAEYFPEEGCETRFANYYRQIKRPVLQRAFGSSSDNPDLRLVLLTSALPGDGKSFTSLNLAFSLARERDSSVLLVDADVAKPNLSRILGVSHEPGLLDAAVDDSLDPQSLVMHTDVPGLEVLPAGTLVEQPSELLTSSHMRQVVLRLSTANPRRIILFDAPPLLLSSEARSLLTVPGQVLLVVRAGKTPTRAVRDALDLIDEHKLTGLILNEGRGGLNDSYYGYESYGSAD